MGDCVYLLPGTVDFKVKHKSQMMPKKSKKETVSLTTIVMRTILVVASMWIYVTIACIDFVPITLPSIVA